MTQIDSEKILVTIDKNLFEQIRLAVVFIHERPYISLGIFRKEGGQFVRGITVAPMVMEKLLPLIALALDEIKHPGAGQ